MFGGVNWFNKGGGGSRNGWGDCRERGIGWLGGVIGGSYLGAADSLRMDVGDSGRGDGGSAIMGGGGSRVGKRMGSERDYCRIPGVTWGLWEDLP